ncbi:hypothetical protein CYFUS_009031 [Cystobacter fuscus]|uniref:Uncharacterized protein n=1 Tax=Cystobacter fuscus TaxID=43 RepID=A0A250JJH9_9BACT|nr:hypothetical protein [Cystobacter fuscus]ATB43551.1 hypothetical protein CYFUS_009031 [Cystobacter fuscus]
MSAYAKEADKMDKKLLLSSTAATRPSGTLPRRSVRVAARSSAA